MDRIALRFQNRWQVLLITILLLLACSPTPLPHAWVDRLNRAAVALQAAQVTQALENIELAIAAEPALANLHLLASDLASFLGENERSDNHLSAIDPKTLENQENFCRLARTIDLAETEQFPDPRWERWVTECPFAYEQVRGMQLGIFSSDPDPNQLPYLKYLLQIRPYDRQIQRAYAQLLSSTNPDQAIEPLRVLSNLPGENYPLERDLLVAIQSSSKQGSRAYTFAQVGQVFARYQRWPMARINFQTAVLEDPDYSEARAYLGLSKEQMGLDGYSEISTALSADPGDPRRYVFLAIHYQKQAEPELALQALDTAARLDPENPAFAAQLGSAFAELGDFSAATQAYLAATDLAPNESQFWLLLARFSLEHDIDLVGLGLPAVRNAISMEPENPVGFELLGTIQFELEEFTLAERSLRSALALEPVSPSTQYVYGLLMQMEGQPEIARAAFLAASLMDTEGRYAQIALRFLE
jgi:Tfp pilus assembly protein PilF